jgi:hypothetical protein
MGEAELDLRSAVVTLHATLFLYGDSASPAWAERLARDIEGHWNEPLAIQKINKVDCRVIFKITAIHKPDLQPEEVWYNDNPRFNFFRMEEYAYRDISSVDGLGSNTGYFKLANLEQCSSTAAHEFGHTLGLEHPSILDIRGRGIPGIMYPRGTLCDPAFQYDPLALPGEKGGTLNPVHRKVLASDIEALQLHKRRYNSRGLAVIGDFSSLYHEKQLPGNDPY